MKKKTHRAGCIERKIRLALSFLSPKRQKYIQAQLLSQRRLHLELCITQISKDLTHNSNLYKLPDSCSVYCDALCGQALQDIFTLSYI